jgi:hypothetical protein
MPKKGTETQSVVASFDETRSLKELIGNKFSDQLSEKDRMIKESFCQKIRDIQKFECGYCVKSFDGYILDPGAQLVLINKNFNLIWDTIPFEKMDAVKLWIEKNHHIYNVLFCPDYHYQIMETPGNSDFEEYRKWFNNHLKGTY